ncbi:DUF6879 family protein [Streptomyces sp. NBC_01803]|uniref:DUF6879 family protein n=1 Tax=Streptomyces sp. NBC_01803 TaxID=2975946 RepID=UPI002DD8C1ED|nr:DUF6879 family protein [Streptomyces sp. NBC_01803]WSA44614.1 hypothetical protein OIE51_10595 [Streptomyces sp. NBC_01803]
MSSSEPTFAELLADCRTTAIHLEMRDVYYSNERFESWQQGHLTDWNDRDSWRRSFHQTIEDAVARGVEVRRARIVSEPVTPYIRWEHYVTTANLLAGEQVRWLPRRMATDLSLPGNDFWVFDDHTARIHHFAGNGDFVGYDFTNDQALITHCAAAFEQIWQRAIPHEEYDPA